LGYGPFTTRPTCPQITGELWVPPGENMPSSAKDTEKVIADARSQVTPSGSSHSSSELPVSRAVAASCEIPLEVHGSQKGGSQYSAVIPFHEETRTVIVFPHGCVLRLGTEVAVGQMLAITNQNSQRGMLTRVTHVRSYPNLKSYVEIEFTSDDPEFWSIDFSEELAAQGYAPGPSESATSTAASSAHDFWDEAETETKAAPSASARESGKAQVKDRAKPAGSVAPAASGKAASEKAPATNAVSPKPSVAPRSPSAVSASPVAQSTHAPKSPAQPSADEFAVDAHHQKPTDDSSSQAWAELLVMEPQQQLSAKELALTRSDVEESLAPAPAHEREAAHLGGDAHPAAENADLISPSVLKELEKLALDHIKEKLPLAGDAEQTESRSASDAATATKPAGASKKKKGAKSEQHEAAAPSRSSPLHTFTGGSEQDAKSRRGAKSNPLHSFTGAPGERSSHDALVPEADSLLGMVESINPHKTQTLADHPDAETEEDFGNFLRDPEPRTAAPRVFTGPAEALHQDAHVALTPLRAKTSKSWMALAAAVVVLVGVVGWWFYPMHGSAPGGNGTPAASAAAAAGNSNSPAQWPSQTPAEASSLDSSGSHPMAIEAHSPGSTSSEAPAASSGESRPESESSGREVIPVPRGSAGGANAQPQANNRGSLPAVNLAAPTSSGNAAASGSVEPPPEVSAGDAKRANNLTGIVGGAPANVPAPAPSFGAASGASTTSAAGGPAPTGGRVREPRLISSVTPIYPQSAMQANVQGDVKIQATIDETGRVTKMKMLSGPLLLQRAAMDALRQWRYQPSLLDEKPVAAELVVTIHFRR
jgi:TonB family protein